MWFRMGLHHRSRFHWSSVLPRCHLACIHRRYADSDAGSDIQQDSLLDNQDLHDNHPHSNQHNELPIVTVHTGDLIDLNYEDDNLSESYVANGNRSISHRNPFAMDTNNVFSNNLQRFRQSLAPITLPDTNQITASQNTDLLIDWLAHSIINNSDNYLLQNIISNRLWYLRINHNCMVLPLYLSKIHFGN